MFTNTTRSLLTAALAAGCLAAPASAAAPVATVTTASGATQSAWVELDAGDRVARTQTGSGAIRTLSNRAFDADEVVLAALPSGAVQFAWTRMDGADTTIVTRRLTAAGRLGRTRLVSRPGFNAAAPQVAATQNGVRFTWTNLQDGTTRSRVFAT
jgi:hypothetical protein